MARGDLSDKQWQTLQPHLPPQHRGQPGRPYVDHRKIINGIRWQRRTGAPWRDLPQRYGPYQTCYDRFVRWRKDGTWQHILHSLQSQADQQGQLDWQIGCVDASVIRAHQHAAGAAHPDLGPSSQKEPEPAPAPPTQPGEPEHLAQAAVTTTLELKAAGQTAQALGYSRGGFSTKIHLVCDGQGQPLAATLSPGQDHDSRHLEAALDAVRVPRGGRGRPKKRMDRLLADRGYGAKRCRAALHKRHLKGLIPAKSNELRHRKKQGRRGGRPYWFDKELYKTRNVVERCFNRLKQWRAVATRYDKLAANFLAGVTLAMLNCWLS